jgi:hypothetical protein
MARNCFNSSNSCTWVDEPPSFILQLLLDDVTLVAAGFLGTLFLTRVSEETGRFLMRRSAVVIYYGLFKKKEFNMASNGKPPM